MANNKSEFFREEILRWILTTQAAMSRPAGATPGIFIGVGTAHTSTGMTEPASGGYTRYAVTTGTFVSSGVGKFSNDTEILFPAATVGWGTIASIGIWTVVSGAAASNLLYVGSLQTPVTVGVNDQFRLAPSAFTVSES